MTPDPKSLEAADILRMIAAANEERARTRSKDMRLSIRIGDQLLEQMMQAQGDVSHGKIVEIVSGVRQLSSENARAQYWVYFVYGTVNYRQRAQGEDRERYRKEIFNGLRECIGALSDLEQRLVKAEGAVDQILEHLETAAKATAEGKMR